MVEGCLGLYGKDLGAFAETCSPYLFTELVLSSIIIWTA